MTESSRFWNTNNVGDGSSSGFDRGAIGSWLQDVFGRGSSGILARVLNELVVSGSASPLSVATGAAIVDGHFYSNDAALSLAVTSPSIGTTGVRVVLEANWTAQTVRAKAIKNTDGNATPPALTQSSGSTYQISLATCTITTGGVIGSLTNETARASMANSPRVEMFGLAALAVLGRASSSSGVAAAIAASADGQALRRSGSSLGFGQIATAGILDDAVTAAKILDTIQAQTAHLASGAADGQRIAPDVVDDTKIGNRVPAFISHQGFSSSDWNIPGSSNFTPDMVRVLFGVTSVTVSSGYGATVDVTLPVALSKPLVFAGILYRSSVTDEMHVYGCYAVVVNNTTIRIYGKRDSSWIESVGLNIAWLAIGPES